jgi:hypothetical protein
MTSFHKVVLEFNQLLTQHKLLESLDYYDSGIISTDNLGQPITGISALKEKTEDFIKNATIDAIEVVSLISEDNLSFTNWWYAFNHKKFGQVAGHRFSVQRWKNNKIIQENHFYVE